MSDDALQTVRAVGDRQLPALRILFANFPADEQESRLQETLSAVERGSLSLDQLWLAEQAGQAVGAALVMAQADGVSLVWPPVIVTPLDTIVIRRALMTQLCRALDQPDVKFGQCLLTPEEAVDAGWLADFGFHCAAELFFLARTLEEPLSADEIPDQPTVETYDESANHARFAQLVEHTYRGSLDCPELNGTRTGDDALAGHRLSGAFQPRGWRLYQLNGQDAAVLLLNEHPDQDAVELTYFGVAPEFRGLGLGARLLSDAISVSRAWNRAVIFLAVDAGNTFANELYAQAGFQEVARRAVWLRIRRELARE